MCLCLSVAAAETRCILIKSVASRDDESRHPHGGRRRWRRRLVRAKSQPSRWLSVVVVGQTMLLTAEFSRSELSKQLPSMNRSDRYSIAACGKKTKAATERVALSRLSLSCRKLQCCISYCGSLMVVAWKVLSERSPNDRIVIDSQLCQHL